MSSITKAYTGDFTSSNELTRCSVQSMINRISFALCLTILRPAVEVVAEHNPVILQILERRWRSCWKYPSSLRHVTMLPISDQKFDHHACSTCGEFLVVNVKILSRVENRTMISYVRIHEIARNNNDDNSRLFGDSRNPEYDRAKRHRRTRRERKDRAEVEAWALKRHPTARVCSTRLYTHLNARNAAPFYLCSAPHGHRVSHCLFLKAHSAVHLSTHACIVHTYIHNPTTQDLIRAYIVSSKFPIQGYKIIVINKHEFIIDFNA